MFYCIFLIKSLKLTQIMQGAQCSLASLAYLVLEP